MKKMTGLIVFGAMAGAAFAEDNFGLNGITGKNIPQAAGEISVMVPEAAKAEIIKHDGHDNYDNHGNHDYHDNHGNHDYHDNHGNHDYHDNHHNHHHYSPVYPDMNCSTWEFTAQTPNTRTEKLTGEEPSFDCYWANGIQYCRSTGRYFTRKVTVNIGNRRLESWEKESLKVCLDSSYSSSVDTDGMLYEYAVASKDGSSFFGGRSTEFTLTPGAKKPSNPGPDELSIKTAGITPAGAAFLTLNDKRADYYRGGTINISVSGIRLPGPDMTPEDILGSFVKIDAKGAFDVAPTYEIKLTDTPKAGKYALTIKFSRRGPLSSGAEAGLVTMLELR